MEGVFARRFVSRGFLTCFGRTRFQSPMACEFELKQFIECTQNQHDITLCQGFNEALRQCKQNNGGCTHTSHTRTLSTHTPRTCTPSTHTSHTHAPHTRTHLTHTSRAVPWLCGSDLTSWWGESGPQVGVVLSIWSHWAKDGVCPTVGCDLYTGGYGTSREVKRSVDRFWPISCELGT